MARDVAAVACDGALGRARCRWLVVVHAGQEKTTRPSHNRNRSGSFPLDNQIICGRCNEAMEVLGQGETPGLESDCKLISIPYEQANGQVVIRGHAVRELFDRWYSPVLAGPGQSH